MDRMLRSLRWVCFFVTCFVFTSISSQKIFPGSYGYGSDSRGAYTLYESTGNASDLPRILTVNTLDPGNFSTGDNTGTFLWAIKQNYPRIILFSVGGVIDLKNRWDELTLVILSSPYCTIYGQTAPYPGITITGATLNIRKNHDVLIQHIHFRPGDDPAVQGTEISCITGWGGNNHIVIDHCSMEWSIDQLFGNNPGNNISLTNNLFAEPLHCNTHPTEGDECHGMFNTFMYTTQISVIGNIYTNGHLRAPYLNSGIEDVYIANNVFHNIEYYAIYLTDARGTGVNTKMDIINNYYIPGDNTMNNRDQLLYLKACESSVRVYLRGNYHPSTTDQTSMPMVRDEAGVNLTTSSPGVNAMSHSPVSASAAYDKAIEQAGAFYWQRDETDTRIINNLKNRRGSMINYTSELSNTYLNISGTSHTLNIPSRPHEDDNNNGFTNIEEWANGSLEEEDATLTGNVIVNGENIKVNYSATGSCTSVSMQLTKANSSTALHSQSNIESGYTFNLHNVCADCGSGNYSIDLSCGDLTEELNFAVSDSIKITAYNPPVASDVINITYYSFSPEPTTVTIVGIDGVVQEYEISNTQVGSNTVAVDISALEPNDYVIRLSRGDVSDQIDITRINDTPEQSLLAETSVDNETITVTYQAPSTCESVSLNFYKEGSEESIYQASNIDNNYVFRLHEVCPDCAAGFYEVELTCGDQVAKSTLQIEDRIEITSYNPQQTNDEVTANFYSLSAEPITVDILLQGGIVSTYQYENVNIGANTATMSLLNLQPGTYVIRLSRGDVSDQFQIVKLEDSAVSDIDINLDISLLNVTVNFTPPESCDQVDLTLTQTGDTEVIYQVSNVSSGHVFNLHEVCPTCEAGDYDLTLQCGDNSDISTTNTFSIEDILQIRSHTPQDTYDVVTVTYFSITASPVTVTVSDLNGVVEQYTDNSTTVGTNTTVVDLATYPPTEYSIRIGRNEVYDEVVVTRLADNTDFDATASIDNGRVSIEYTAPETCEVVNLSVISPTTGESVYEANDIESGYAFEIHNVCSDCGPGTYNIVLTCGDLQTQTAIAIEDKLEITSFAPIETYNNVTIDFTSYAAKPITVTILFDGNVVNSYEENNIIIGSNSIEVSLLDYTSGQYTIQLTRDNVGDECEVTLREASTTPDLTADVSLDGEDITVNYTAGEGCDQVDLTLISAGNVDNILHEATNINTGYNFNLLDVCSTCGADDYTIVLTCGEAETSVAFTIIDRLDILSHDPHNTQTTVNIEYYSVSPVPITVTVSGDDGVVDEYEVSNTVAGNNSLSVDLSALQEGTYTITLSRGDASASCQALRLPDDVVEQPFESSSSVENTSVTIYYEAPSDCEEVALQVTSGGQTVHTANNIESGYSFNLSQVCSDCSAGDYTAILTCGELETQTAFTVVDKIEISSYSPMQTEDDVTVNFNTTFPLPVTINILSNGSNVSSYQETGINTGDNTIVVSLQQFDAGTYTIQIERGDVNDQCEVTKIDVNPTPELTGDVSLNGSNITVNYTASEGCDQVDLSLSPTNNLSNIVHQTNNINSGYSFNLLDVCASCGAGNYTIVLSCGEIETSVAFTINDRLEILSHEPASTQTTVNIEYYSLLQDPITVTISGSNGVVDEYSANTVAGNNSLSVDLSGQDEGNYTITLSRGDVSSSCQAIRLPDESVGGQTFESSSSVQSNNVSIYYEAPADCEEVSVLISASNGQSIHDASNIESGYTFNLNNVCSTCEPGTYTATLTCGELETQTSFTVVDEIEISSYSPKETLDEVSINFTSVFALPVNIRILRNGTEVSSYQESGIKSGSNNIVVNLLEFEADTYTIQVQRGNASDDCAVVKNPITLPELTSSVDINGEDVTVNYQASDDCTNIGLKVYSNSDMNTAIYEASDINNGYTFDLRVECLSCGAGNYTVILNCGEVESSTTFTITDRIEINYHAPQATRGTVNVNYLSLSASPLTVRITGTDGVVSEYEVSNVDIGDNSLNVEFADLPADNYRITLARGKASDNCDVVRLPDETVVDTEFELTQVKPKITTGDVYITFTSPIDIQVSINVIDELGLTVHSVTHMAEAGTNKMVIRLQHLENGKYTIQLVSDEGEDRETISLQKTL